MWFQTYSVRWLRWFGTLDIRSSFALMCWLCGWKHLSCSNDIYCSRHCGLWVIVPQREEENGVRKLMFPFHCCVFFKFEHKDAFRYLNRVSMCIKYSRVEYSAKQDNRNILKCWCKLNRHLNPWSWLYISRCKKQYILYGVIDDVTYWSCMCVRKRVPATRGEKSQPASHYYKKTSVIMREDLIITRK